MSRPISFLSDFGLDDEFVGVVHGVIARIDPAARVIDVTHGVPRGDVRAGALTLLRAVQYLPEGVVLAVVDPGVGTERRILVAEASGQRFVAPDNGLLTPFLDEAVAAGKVWAVTREELFLEAPGSTFHGRDRFAPVAAAIARSARVVHASARVGAGELDRMGSVIEDPVRLDHPPPRQGESADGTVLAGRVARVDRYGNLVTDLPAGWLPTGATPEVEVGERRTGRWVSCYAELPPGEPGALVGSRATVELSLRGASLADAWEVGRGAPVRIVLRNS